MSEPHPIAAAASEAKAVVQHDGTNLAASLINFFSRIEDFFKTKAEPAIAVAEQVAGVAETVDPAIAPEVTAGEAAVAGVEQVVDHL